MKIAFDFITDETPLFVAVGEILKREGHEVFGLTLGKRWEALWKGRFHTASISIVSKKEKAINFQTSLLQELEQINQKYKEFNPSSFLHADRFICEFNRKHQIALLVDTFKSVERFFEDESPDIYLCTPIAYLFNLVTHAVCKHLGIPHISIYTTRGEVPRFTFTTGVSFRWDKVSDTYQKFMSGSPVLSNKTLEEAEEKLKNFLSSPHRPYYMKSARINYKFKMIFAKEFLTRLKYYYIDGWGKDDSDYMTQTPFWYAIRDSKRLILAGIFSRFKKQIFDNTEKNQQYYLFPLNVKPEAATLIYGEWYVDLISTIQNISRCIPLGTYLYIKEHTSAFGRRGMKFYRELKKLHNVRLLGPWENTDSLITNSLGVIVISSTMGWEALLHGKPTYILGNLFCNDISPSLKVEGYDDLRRRLNKDYHGGQSQNIVSQNSLIAFLAAMQAVSYPGMIGPAKLDIYSSVLSKKNVSQVTEGIKQIIADFCRDKIQHSINRASL